MKNKKKTSGNNIFLIIIFILLFILILFFPKIYNIVETLKMPKIITNSEKKKEQLNVESSVLSNLHYPMMSRSIYTPDTYYTLDKFKISDMSNEDILYNAFLDIYEGNMVSYNGYMECTQAPKQFKEEYLDLRVNNILGKDITYTKTSFNVYEDSKSNYKGTWVYDSNNSMFIYKGLCSSNINATTYYNIEQFISASYLNDDIIVYKYVGFATINNNKYIIYKDANRTIELSSGTISDAIEIDKIFEQLDNGLKLKYKYTFKNNLCSYREYCLYEGIWE